MDLPGRVAAVDAEQEAAVEECAAASSGPDPVRVNWLFTGVWLGLGSWLLVLSVIFAAFGRWAVAATLFAGPCLCLLAVWRAGRRAEREREFDRALLG
jgi:hypothetical protein